MLQGRTTPLRGASPSLAYIRMQAGGVATTCRFSKPLRRATGRPRVKTDKSQIEHRAIGVIPDSVCGFRGKRSILAPRWRRGLAAISGTAPSSGPNPAWRAANERVMICPRQNQPSFTILFRAFTDLRRRGPILNVGSGDKQDHRARVSQRRASLEEKFAREGQWPRDWQVAHQSLHHLRDNSVSRFHLSTIALWTIPTTLTRGPFLPYRHLSWLAYELNDVGPLLLVKVVRTDFPTVSSANYGGNGPVFLKLKAHSLLAHQQIDPILEVREK